MNCNNGINVPTLPTDPCNGFMGSTLCIKKAEPIVFLDLPANSTLDEIINNIILALTSDNNRITDLEESVLHNVGDEIKDGKLTATNFAASAIVEYADNAAALLGGLSVGDFYRTGDLLKVVH